VLAEQSYKTRINEFYLKGKEEKIPKDKGRGMAN